MDDSLLAEVEGEVEIMRSAYSEEFFDVREQDVWKIPRPPEVLITLGPHHSQGGTLHSHVKVTLRILTTDKYPHAPAKVSVEKFDGLSDKEIEELNQLLKRQTEKFAHSGTVVMLELCQQTQRYLSEHARPYSESIYAEMVASQESRRKADQKAEEENRRQQEIQEEAHRTIMEEEVARVKRALKEEERQRREERFRLSTPPDFGSSSSPTHGPSDSPSHKRSKGRSVSEGSSDSVSGESLGRRVLHFPLAGKQERVVHVVGFIGERKAQSCHILEGQEKASSEKCIIFEWNVKAKRTGRKGNHLMVGQDIQIEELVNKCSVLEKEMSSLLRLSNSSLIHYLAMRVNHHVNDGVQVFLVKEHVQGMSIKYFMDLQIPLSHIPLIKHITHGTLCAVNYLHQNNVVHRDLRDSCIYLDSRTKLVRVGDYGIECRIAEAVLEFGGGEMPALYPPSPGRGGKKGDVYRLGLIILSLCLGNRVQQMIPELPANLNTDLHDFLRRCLEVNEQVRWSAEQLLSHSFFCTSEVEHSQKNKDQGKRVAAEMSDSEGENEECCPRNTQEHSSEVSLHLPSNLKGHSRLNQEYIILEWLGRGGFGHVFKVRNKVDDRVYAVKRIQLDQQSQVMRKKILREVQLLSSLNHENVVRYYTSWIDEFIQNMDERSSVDEDSQSHTASVNIDVTSDSHTGCVPTEASLELKKGKDSSADIDSESAWSIVFAETKSTAAASPISNIENIPSDKEDDDEEDDDDDDDWLMGSLRPMLKEEDDISYDSIEFNDSEDGQDQTDCICDEIYQKPRASSSNERKLQFLYIQMQLCEKNTLRQAINKGLYLDEGRTWQLFREMVNGLDYINNQGLIHRDLKPGNIFLDSADHVKIGDFGLATATIKAKTAADNALKVDVEESTQSNFLTGQVGTTLYIAPEVTKGTGKVSYSNKVDIYSLGIILFEMIYPPLTTGMERVKVLSDLRKPEIIFPDDVPKRKNSSIMELITWMLQQDPQKRPSTSDILKSPLLPPLTAEEQKFVATLEARLQNTRSSDYQDILNLVFKPSARPELEATFEVNLGSSSDYWNYWKYDCLHSLFVSVFKAHGAIWVPTSFYVPKDSFYGDKDNLVSLMARRGELVSAQYDLRYPFARFAARNEIKFMRRYCIDRVQRSFKASGIHPKETYECAWDIISPMRELHESVTRVLIVAQDIIQLILQRRSHDVYIRLGHMDLVRIILSNCRIEENLHTKVISLLKEWNVKRIPVSTLGDYLCSLGVAKASAESLKGFLVLDGPLDEVVTTIKSKGVSTRRMNSAGALKKVLEELKEVKEVAMIMGIKFEIKLKPLLVADAHLYSGLMWQFLMDVHRKKGVHQDLLAQGGSYSHLIQQHRKQLVSGKRNFEVPGAVGVSLFLEKFECCVDCHTASEHASKVNMVADFGCGCEVGMITVMVCAVGPKQLKERVDIVRKLRAAKITADHSHCLTQRDAEIFLEELNVSNAVMLTGVDKADVRICSDPTARTLERKVALEKVPEFVLKNLGVSENNVPSGSSIRSDSRLPTACSQEDYQIKIEYITKRQSRNKDAPKLDQQIQRDVQTMLSSRWPVVGSGAGTGVEVWAVELDKKVVLALAALDTDSTTRNFNDSVSEVKSQFSDHKDYLDEICKMLQRKLFSKKKVERSVPLVLYSILSNTYKRIF